MTIAMVWENPSEAGKQKLTDLTGEYACRRKNRWFSHTNRLSGSLARDGRCKKARKIEKILAYSVDGMTLQHVRERQTPNVRKGYRNDFDFDF